MSEQKLQGEIGALAGRLHAATANFVDLVTALDDSAEWSGIGMRSCAHWVTIATGVDLWHAREMVRAGHALRSLPLIHEAFAAGRLSFDKVRVLTHVASADDEVIWLELALEASGAQLARICLQYRRCIAADEPHRAVQQRARRRLSTWWLDEDGMLALYATLPPEEGQLVLKAIESAVSRPPAGPVANAGPELSEDDEPEHPHGAWRADALVRICERWLSETAASSPAGSPAPGLVVHVDIETLTGVDDGGRCHLDDGPAISLAAARRIGCDAEVVAVVERGGVPLDVGRSRRVVSGKLRRLLQLRDRGCRYPGCTVPAAATEGHHVVHWVDGGPTEIANLVSLCRFHHHRHHEGAFRILPKGGTDLSRHGSFRFETADGLELSVGRTGVNPLDDHGRRGWRQVPYSGHPIAAARGGGQSFDLDHTLLVVAGNIANATARAREAHGPGP